MHWEAPVTITTLREASDTPTRGIVAALSRRMDRSSDEIDLVDHTSALPASDTDEYAFFQSVEAVGSGLDFDGTAEGVFACVDVFSASEPLEDRRASVAHALRLNVEQISVRSPACSGRRRVLCHREE